MVPQKKISYEEFDLDRWGRQTVVSLIVMAHSEAYPGEPAPGSGPYEELNVFGTPTGKTIFVLEGEELPSTPRGFSWRSLADRSAVELRNRAARFRAMADTASDPQTMNSLRKLAEQFQALANEREQQERGIH
jgi:hypothetical protein